VPTYGNLANRVLTFAARHFEGRVPEPGDLDDEDRAMLSRTETAFATVAEDLEACHFRSAIAEAMEVAREANRYLDAKAPWFQIKQDRQAAATSLYTMIQVISSLKTLLCPFLPFSSQALHEMLGFQHDLLGRQYIEELPEETRSHLGLRYEAPVGEDRWQSVTVPAGQAFGPIRPLFRKLEEAVAAEEVERMLARSG